MKITFKNGQVDMVKARRVLAGRADFFKRCIDAEDLESVPVPASGRGNGDSATQDFYTYGLCLDYVLAGDSEESFLRYQLSTGGPGDEVRFYYTPGNWTTPYRIEFVYLDWGVGVGFDVSSQDWAKWLADQFGADGSDTVEEKFNESMATN